MKNKIRIGTCSWKYESWRGLLYPDFGEINFLEEYSKKLNTVEIDQWFWSLHGEKITLPNPNVVNAYNDNTPNDFKFTIKVPNSITLTNQYKTKEKNDHFLSIDLMQSFLHSLNPIKNKIGMLIFQFEYLNKQKMKSYSEFENKFFEFRKNIDDSVPIGIEIRNPNYLHKNYFEFLNEANISVVFLEGYYMPKITEIFNKYSNQISAPVVIRLHGFDRKGIEERSKKVWNSILDPKDEDLSEIANMIAQISSRNVDVYLNVNNHYEGSAPLTIDKIKKMLSNHKNK